MVDLVGPPESRAGSNKESLLSRIGRGLVSFTTGVPQIELDRKNAANELIRQQGRRVGGEADLIENQLSNQGTYRELLRVAMGDDPEAAQQAVNKMIETNPDLGLKMDEVLSVRDQRDLERNAAEASELLTLPPEQRGAVIQRMMQDESIGIDNEMLASLATMHPKEANLTLMAVKGRALTEQQRQVAERGGDAPGELQTHNALVEQSQSADPNISDPAKIALGLEPRAVGSGTITTATIPGLTEDVAESRGTIEGSVITAKGLADRQLALPAVRSRKASIESKLGTFESAAQEIIDDPSLWMVVGPARLASLVPGSPGADLLAKIETLQSKAGLAVLQDMRDNSKTGGAVGQVSNFEQQLFQNNLAPLANLNVSPDAYRESVTKVRDFARDSRTRINSAFDFTYPELLEDESQTNSETQPTQAQPTVIRYNAQGDRID